MTRHTFFGELLISGALLAILGLFLLPTNLIMPTTVNTMLAVGLMTLFLIFASFIWKEKALDERDETHRLVAGRVSFLVGASVLVVAILLQSLSHDIDPWLVIALISMVASKVVARIYSQMNG